SLFQNDREILKCNEAGIFASGTYFEELPPNIHPNYAFCQIGVEDPTELLSLTEESIRLVYVQTIDWTTCGNQAFCGVAGKCLSLNADFIFPATTSINPDCEVGFWI
ncbi:hypothetical protein PMAYCL1PPCAC_03767, partial [Pristionchus mayeri]